MTLTPNIFVSGIVNPILLGDLSTPITFSLECNTQVLTMVNASDVEEAAILIKGSRGNINIPLFGNADISDGIPITISKLSAAAINMPMIYKSLGEDGDTLTISSDSDDSDKILCWISE